MAARDSLFTIGEFSKVTGIGIHSLRYYDEIGALKPEFVDPVSNYRYYGTKQLSLIPAINICKDAGISLSDFGDYCKDGRIDYSDLISISRKAIDKKLDAYAAKQQALVDIEELLGFISDAPSSPDTVKHMQGVSLLSIPFEDSVDSPDCSDALLLISDFAKQTGIRFFPFCYGLMITGSADNTATYAVAPLVGANTGLEDSCFILNIPSGYYRFCSLEGNALSGNSFVIVCGDPENPVRFTVQRAAGYSD